MMRFFRQTAPATMPAHIGADSLEKPHHMVTLRFSEAEKDHANFVNRVVTSTNIFKVAYTHPYEKTLHPNTYSVYKLLD